MGRTPRSLSATTGIRGGALFTAIQQRAEALGLERHEIADALGITYPYLLALSAGKRPVSGLSEDKFRRIAQFLERPLIEVLMLAEVLYPEDFIQYTSAETLERELEVAISSMRANPQWGMLAPSPEEWQGLSLASRIGIVLLWERVQGQELLRKARLIRVVGGEEENGGGEAHVA